jgi:L-threonylcarbamoyladenylate synthase
MNDIRTKATTKISPATPEAIAQAAGIIRAGGLIGLPTETVYGLAADATRPEAVAKIYAAKGRPRFNPLIAHIATLEDAHRLALVPAAAHALIERFWPGPLTLVLPFRPDAAGCELARAGLDSVALRMPSHPIARAVIAAAGVPISAPSANRSGRISATSAEDVAAELGDSVDLVLDAGPTEIGVESTIVSLLGDTPTLLRAGGTPRTEIEAMIGRPLALAGADDTAPRAPGMMTSHYAPAAPVRLDATAVLPDEALLTFGMFRPGGIEHARVVLNLSERGDTLEAAANLYRMLRRLDGLQPRCIAVAPIPGDGLGEAINDRLRRAAAPR